jgi:polysaccharide biosynthesis protein PslH
LIANLPTIFVLPMDKRSVILIVCNRVPFPLKDGGALAMYAMIKGWHDLGKKVHLLAMNTSRHSISGERLPDLFHQIAGFEMLDLNTEIRVLPTVLNFILSNKPQHAERFYNQHFEKRLVQTIQEIQPDMIQLESIYLQEYMPAIRMHSKNLLMQRLHNIEAQIWQRLATEASNIFKRFYLKNLAKRIGVYEQKVWQECDALIPISKMDEQYIQHSGCSTQICTIPYGIKLMQKTQEVSKGRWTAYHIGAMDWQPNVEAMEWMRDEIVPAILKRVPDFQFQFAGRGMLDSFMKNKEASFRCIGEVEQAASFIADKKILIVPLRSGSGIRIKTLEAMSEAKLVISTSIGIQGIDAVDKVHYLRADTAIEFAEQIEWVMNNIDAAEQIASNARALMHKEYDQAILMRRLDYFVEKLP